jgi:hypothetical protein
MKGDAHLRRDFVDKLWVRSGFPGNIARGDWSRTARPIPSERRAIRC